MTDRDRAPEADVPGEDPVPPGPTATPLDASDAVQATPDAPEGPVLLWDPEPPRRRRRRWPWIVVPLLVLLLAAGAAGAVWLVQDARARADAARVLTDAQQSHIAATLAAQDETAAQLTQQREAYRGDLAAWEADQAAAERWRTTDEVPAPGFPNPGGDAIPGDDPHGRAFLDAIGATDVQVLFDAGRDNCGYDLASDSPFTYSVGGCYDSRFRNRLFLAWERGAEDLVWSVFVHEAMHWYQYREYYPLFVSAQRAGYGHDDYRGVVESDASCRAVALYGIDPDRYEGSSSPCDVDGWYDGWLPDRLAEMGVRVREPVAEDYEVREVTRP
ncbi:hypothetical protein [Microbacterium sp. GXF7504]